MSLDSIEPLGFEIKNRHRHTPTPGGVAVAGIEMEAVGYCHPRPQMDC